MSPGPVDEVAARAAIAELHGVADALTALAGRLPLHATVVRWGGGARHRHDREASAIARELRALAVHARTVADDAANATSRARHVGVDVGGPPRRVAAAG